MSTSFEPTDEQRGVIGGSEPSMIVTAAAGAGKTAVLVERYLRHVSEGVEPDQILTITFTRKAAAEMKNRIVAKLRDQGQFQQAQVAETGPIQTIHSFCERLLRENALEAGLDPQFEIASEGDSTEMLERAIRDALSLPLDEWPEAERLISLLAGQRAFGQGASPYARLEQAVKEIVVQLRGSGLTAGDLQDVYTTPDGLRRLFEEKILDDLPLPVRTHVEGHAGGPLSERLIAGYKAWGEKPPRWIASKPDVEADREAIEHTAGLFQLAAVAWSSLEAEMDREQRLDFTELESRALRLLGTSEVTRQRVRSQYRHVMVDEAQDVNPVQDEILRAMGIESEMLVGDEQQAIFGFRLADRELFRKRVEGAQARRLSVNKRSDAGILRFVDLVFGRLWEDYTPMSPPPSPVDLNVVELPMCAGVELWPIAEKDTGIIAAQLARMREEQGIPLSKIVVLIRDSPFAQELLTSLTSAGIPARIAGGTERFYARLEVRDLANTLRAVGDPHDDFAMLAMLRSPVVGLSLDAIALLARARPVVEALESFVSPVAEDSERMDRFLRWFTPLRSEAGKLPAWEVLAEIFARSDYLVALAKRRNSAQVLANVRKLLTLAADSPDLGPVEYAERIREIQRLRHREGDAPAEDEKAEIVTIMTIHKAKGLEWPVVVVPQMHKPIGRRQKEVEIDARLGLAAARFGRRTSIFHTWMAHRRTERETEEELRLLYVAFTRARNRLCVVASPASGPNTLSRRVASIIGKTPPPGLLIREPDPTPSSHLDHGPLDEEETP